MKPGAPLMHLPDPPFMIENTVKAKTPIVNISIVEEEWMDGSNKENEDQVPDDSGGKANKKVSKVRKCFQIVVYSQ
jgi:hypothetical protein